MLQNIKELYGHQLSASDGEIGHIKDFYFDDQSWALRYLVVDTGSWLSGRQVLLTPHAFGSWDRTKKSLSINLTKKKIENGPSIETHRPVSRQYEEDYYRYYGWPAYWDGPGIWGAAGIPLFTAPPLAEEVPFHSRDQRDDVHLRSTVAVKGYEIQAADGPVGTVSSFLIDDQNWSIADLVIETGPWYSGREVLISPARVDRIVYATAKVFVRLAKADVQWTAEHEVVSAGV